MLAAWDFSINKGAPMPSLKFVSLIYFFCMTALLCSCGGTAPQFDQSYDIIIADGTVYADGETPPSTLDVGISDGRIVAIGELNKATAEKIVNASGLLVVPGFIDAHSHADRGGSLEEYLLQGVTTVIVGNCGRSASVPEMAEHYDSLEGEMGPNYAGLIGHGTLRASVELFGTEPTTGQMQRMKEMVAEGMRAGAFGLSTGLIYNPGFNATTDEVIELASVAAEYDGLYATHMRSENSEVLDAVREALQIGRESGARVQISHVKCAGPLAWDLSTEYLGLVEQAAREGLDVWMDQYPYTASQTTINAVIPDWAEADWKEAAGSRRQELEEGIRKLLAGRGGAERVYMVSGPFPKRYLNDVAEELGKTPVDTIIEDIGLDGARAIYHMMQDVDVNTFMTHPRVMTGSDGPSSTHPRGHGSFPRVWGVYGRERGLLSQQQCVMKTSTLAARQFRLIEQLRGRIAEGYHADIVLIDPHEIIDHASFDEPVAAPSGIEYVLVNGRIAVSEGNYTGALPGKVLRSYDSESTVVFTGQGD